MYVLQDNNGYKQVPICSCMGNQRDVLKALRVIRDLENEVRKYFSTHNHRGYTGDWKLERLEYPEEGSDSRTVLAIPKGMGEELVRVDPEWFEGLAEIGEKYRVDLRIPLQRYISR